jgi:hypothetical protein
MPKISTKYLKDQECTILISQYNTGSTAIQLISPEGEHLMNATVNIPTVILNPDQVCIKDYSENQGILAELIRLNIVSQPEFYITSGFVDIPVCQLHDPADWQS